ncbi:M48 family metalloprotease [Natronolimnobius sp. AArcel1]|uniref:M48 family metalloprotease n=1 Tax=Natronolimnobius sp. AArcel1 TaxID=1679093 RepID=UPI0013EAB518|nr:M48 family metalloprotease [Natronolimnobius sp. AArcel1]NGM68440.1 M48 family metalloprotease [Natronolimnobius sp. AArcel1]
MALSLVLLVTVTVAFVAAVWGLFYALFALLGDRNPGAVATVLTLVILGAIAVLELWQCRTIERSSGAREISPADYPDLHATTTRLATILDVPQPTLEVSDTQVPEAMLVGFHPESARLIVSAGTLEALSDDELEAVLAHELAHLANRDAMVMTAISTPVVIADGLKGRAMLAITRGESPFIVFMFPFLLVGGLGWALARTIVAVLSRQRELVADRAAADVTGSPAALASALRTLDEHIAEAPRQDLRAAEGVSSLSILPLRPEAVTPVKLGPDGNIEPFLWSIRKPLGRLSARLFRTHPPTAERLEALAALERDQHESREDVSLEA